MNWLDMNLSETISAINDMGLPSFRAKQIFSWLHKGVDFPDMQNLPKELRKRLADERAMGSAEIIEKYHSALDDTCKYLFKLDDDALIEGVLMRYKHGNTLCISSQLGCRMGCKFCASGLDGLLRNLNPGEMLGQVLAVEREQNLLPNQDSLHKQARAVHNIVMMGSGEALDNYDNTIRFLKIINSKESMNISLRNISVSTCGLADRIPDLARELSGVNLSISLHAANDDLRKTIMPIANKHNLAELMQAAREFIRITSRRVIFEYALIEGVNNGRKDIDELSALLRGMQCHVNVIPLNNVKEQALRGTSRQEAHKFVNELEKNGLSATVRREMGRDIEGACGQLRRRYISDK